jgi:16S rRNA processing protein RimM
VVRGERGERLVPLAPYVTIDRESRRIRVEAPEGLLEEEKG